MKKILLVLFVFLFYLCFKFSFGNLKEYSVFKNKEEGKSEITATDFEAEEVREEAQNHVVAIVKKEDESERAASEEEIEFHEESAWLSVGESDAAKEFAAVPIEIEKLETPPLQTEEIEFSQEPVLLSVGESDEEKEFAFAPIEIEKSETRLEPLETEQEIESLEETSFFSIEEDEEEFPLEVVETEKSEIQPSQTEEKELNEAIQAAEAAIGEFGRTPQSQVNEADPPKTEDPRLASRFTDWLESKKKKPPPPKESVSSVPWPKRLTGRYAAGDQGVTCIPPLSNYGTLGLFLAPDYRLGSIMPFIDLRGHRFDNGTYAANGGLGARYIPNPEQSRFCRLVGFNAYYDYRQGCLGDYQQVSGGLEILGSRWDFRLNGYLPFGKKTNVCTCIFDDYIGDYFAIKQNIESISYSINGEVGCLLLNVREKFFFYAATGPYFLAGNSGGSFGGEVRVRPQYRDYIALDLSWRHDNIFETIWQAEVILTLPFYQMSNRNKSPCGISDRQIYQPVERFEVMPLTKRTRWFTNF